MFLNFYLQNRETGLKKLSIICMVRYPEIEEIRGLVISYLDIFSNRVADRFRTEQRLKQKLNEDFNSEGVS